MKNNRAGVDERHQLDSRKIAAFAGLGFAINAPEPRQGLRGRLSEVIGENRRRQKSRHRQNNASRDRMQVFHSQISGESFWD